MVQIAREHSAWKLIRFVWVIIFRDSTRHKIALFSAYFPCGFAGTSIHVTEVE